MRQLFLIMFSVCGPSVTTTGPWIDSVPPCYSDLSINVSLLLFIIIIIIIIIITYGPRAQSRGH